MKTKKVYTDEEREAARERQQQLVKDAVEQLRSSEGWQQWLQTRSRFHKYSLGNQLLIALQSERMLRKEYVSEPPIAVAGFRKWLELGYAVRKRPEIVPEGQWAIRIWAPCPPSKKQIKEAEENGEKPKMFFKLTNVFGDNQVDPLAPPADPKPITPPITKAEGDSMASAWDDLVALATECGATVSLEDTRPAGGYYRPSDKHIGINECNSVNQRVRTLIHELAHMLVRVDRNDDDPDLSYAQEELVVESVAFSVCGTFGFDTSGYSIPYLAVWSENENIDVLEATAKMVNRLACRIEDAVMTVEVG